MTQLAMLGLPEVTQATPDPPEIVDWTVLDDENVMSQVASVAAALADRYDSDAADLRQEACIVVATNAKAVRDMAQKGGHLHRWLRQQLTAALRVERSRRSQVVASIEQLVEAGWDRGA